MLPVRVEFKTFLFIMVPTQVELVHHVQYTTRGLPANHLATEHADDWNVGIKVLCTAAQEISLAKEPGTFVTVNIGVVIYS